jgi:hypothetical protein
MKTHVLSLALLSMVLVSVSALAQASPSPASPASAQPGVSPQPEGPPASPPAGSPPRFAEGVMRPPEGPPPQPPERIPGPPESPMAPQPEQTPGLPGERMPRPPEFPGKLEEAIQVALQNNPEVRVAEARLRAAEAELMQVRQQVVRELTEVYPDWTKMLRERDRTADVIAELKDRGHMSDEQRGRVNSLEIHVDEVKERIVSIEARLRYLIGATPGFGPRGPRPEPEMRPRLPGPVVTPRPPLEGKSAVVATLRSLIAIQFQDARLGEVLKKMSDDYGINIAYSEAVAAVPITINVTGVTLADGLTAIAELTGGEVCFVVRDYGVLAVPTESARLTPGPALPPYIPYLGPPMEPR